MSITSAEVYTDVWTLVRNILTADKPKITNSTTGTTKTASIVASFTDIRTGIPTIIIEPSNKSEVMDVFGKNRGSMEFVVNVSCYYSNTLGVDQLAQSVENIVAEADTEDLSLIGIDTNYDYDSDPDTKFHTKVVTFMFTRG